ncbi:MAG: L-aspartate oxidase [Candidatus Saganbacteria bacterium]|nr:L-aspartate oxidase [Candidatus Saganbacteria bacterium]
MSQECDILIIGAGIAGLRAALTASQFGKVILLTKGKIGESATEKAQGGIAAAIDEIRDSTQFHFEDTIKAGAGLCNEDAVRILVNEGVDRVKELIEMGAQFDKAETEGGFALALEGAHKRRRILHAGDATGAEIEKTLGYNVIKEGLVEVYPLTLGIKLEVNDGQCFGAVALDTKNNKIETFFSKATILTTGGVCQNYLYTTNPEVATGDGVAMAYNEGAEVTDMEFIQFHPTTLVHSKEFEDIVALPQFLISEAVRGEGAILLNNRGERFIEELAPRDIVSRAIVEEMNKTNADHVFLSLKLPPEKTKNRFPVIYKTCLERGLDITRDQIPVAPGAHYFMGGVKTDTNAKTNIKNLFAAGECASLGVHGANRLASNSLLDGLVFGHRAALSAREVLNGKVKFKSSPSPFTKNTLTPREIKRYMLIIKTTMWNDVGIIRSEQSLKNAQNKLNKLPIFTPQDRAEAELQNMLCTARLITQAALDRKESRGAHFRTDHTKIDDIKWKKHLIYKK